MPCLEGMDSKTISLTIKWKYDIHTLTTLTSNLI